MDHIILFEWSIQYSPIRYLEAFSMKASDQSENLKNICSVLPDPEPTRFCPWISTLNIIFHIARLNISILDEDCEKLQREKEVQRAKYEKNKEDILFEHAKEKEDLITQFATEKRELQEEINAVVAEHNEAMIVAESEKQQELSVKESEKARFQEQYNNSQRELKATLVSLDRVKRDGAAKAEQDREAMNRLTAEIKNFKGRIFVFLHFRLIFMVF